jgi:hypothetical protein
MFRMGRASGGRLLPTSKQKTPVVEHKGLFSSGVVFLAYARIFSDLGCCANRRFRLAYV